MCGLSDPPVGVDGLEPEKSRPLLLKSLDGVGDLLEYLKLSGAKVLPVLPLDGE